ncbi:MAG: hypothetical protein Q9179_002001 [Wetmoreana sp. 5 TL-2023]
MVEYVDRVHPSSCVATSSQNTTGSYPRPHFFISRPDHTITPLIAVDELPDYVRIAGVPAVMTQADTQAMMSLGVKERSMCHYDMHLVNSSSSTNYEEHTGSSGASESDRPSKPPTGALGTESLEKLHDGTEATLANSTAIKTKERPETHARGKDITENVEPTHERVEDEGPADVEKWRQQVEDIDETQAKIDALIAASEQTNEETEEKVKAEIPRIERAKSRLVPGKKVYCSHWIRTGECEFVQVGCLYKHEMPDDETLNAIGIRSLPAWYITAHPEEARKRGFGRANGASGWPWRARPSSSPSLGSFRMGLHTHSQPFRPPPSFGLPGKSETPFFHPTARFSPNTTQPSIQSNKEQQPPFPRVQELSEHQYQQWQNSSQHPGYQLQLVRRPYRSPGYNTFPFELPARVPVSAPSPVLSQTQPAPIWEPRQSKLTHGLAYGEESSRLSPSQDDTAIPRMQTADVQLKCDGPGPSSYGATTWKGQILKSNPSMKEPSDSAASSPKVSNATLARHYKFNLQKADVFTPLKPSPPSPKVLTDRERKPSVSSDLFALAPNVSSPPHRRFFVPPGEERPTPNSNESKRARKLFGNDIKEALATSDRHASTRRAARARSGSSELLLDLEQ